MWRRLDGIVSRGVFRTDSELTLQVDLKRHFVEERCGFAGRAKQSVVHAG